MAPRKRNEAQRELDKAAMVLELWKGVSQEQVAELLGISQQQVSLDWTAELERIRAGRTHLVQDWLDARLARLEALQVKMLGLLERSELPTEVVDMEPKTGKDGKSRMGKSKVRKNPPKPNPRWAELVLRAMRMELELLGLLKAEAPEAAPVSPEVPAAASIRSVQDAAAMLRRLGPLGDLGNVLRYDRTGRKPGA